MLSFLYGAAALIVSGCGALMLYEIIERRWPMIKDSLIGPYDTERDS